jgi:hypothetical protein
MSLGILEEIQATDAEVHQLEQLLAEHPDRRSLRLALQSLEVRQEALGEEFNTVADRIGVDVCRYRLFSEADERPSIGTLAKIWNDFQTLFTTVYDAVKTGPKQRAKFSAEVESESALHWGYTFVGSVGVVLTIPNERLLVEDTSLDQAVSQFTELVKSDSSEHIARASKTLGRATVIGLKQWADDHIKARLGADFQWARGEAVRAEFFIQEPEIQNLRRAIVETSDEIEEDFTVIGQLVGIDVESRTFHLRAPDREIRGKIDESIGAASLVEVPQLYSCNIRRWSWLNYATGEEKETYRLLSLDEPRGGLQESDRLAV